MGHAPAVDADVDGEPAGAACHHGWAGAGARRRTIDVAPVRRSEGGSAGIVTSAARTCAYGDRLADVGVPVVRPRQHLFTFDCGRRSRQAFPAEHAAGGVLHAVTRRALLRWDDDFLKSSKAPHTAPYAGYARRVTSGHPRHMCSPRRRSIRATLRFTVLLDGETSRRYDGHGGGRVRIYRAWTFYGS